MMEKIEISDEKRERIIDKAGHLADKLGQETMACAPTTLGAIVDAFKSEGIDLFTDEERDMLMRSFIALHGGIAMTGVGTCGAVTAGTFVISHVVGVPLEKLKENGNLNYAASVPAAQYIVDNFEDTYGSINCLRVRYNRVQRALDLMDPDARILEMTFSMHQPEKCAMMAEDFEDGRDQTPPVQGARWACEAICDLLEKEPEERLELPPHLQGLGPEDMAEKLQKVVKALKDLDWGRPGEKISYKDYKTFMEEGKEAVEENRIGSLSAPSKDEEDYEDYIKSDEESED